MQLTYSNNWRGTGNPFHRRIERYGICHPTPRRHVKADHTISSATPLLAANAIQVSKHRFSMVVANPKPFHPAMRTLAMTIANLLDQLARGSLKYLAAC